ncbi:endophilin-B1-like isoform X3 [Clupea harengus]|uniref:Endophilin-B1-like isoform X3 n=1 Tax=Clupea harengus TaxID=7950 RepID=A0A6P8EHD6_CLUHA|nr:endophilin-B1-like isoform X3 [Clupea harengus]
MDFNVRRLAADAGTLLSRAVQYTEEVLGQAERTELDSHLENLLDRAEATQQCTEKIMKQTEVLLQPNPNVRMEEFLYEKLEKMAPVRPNNLELLGECMIDAGHELGPGRAYGNALIKCGEAEKQLGSAEREFVQSSAINFIAPLRNFIEGDYKTIVAERKILQNMRLDLDAAKTRLKKAKEADARSAAETELRISQSEFDRQAEITRLLLEGHNSTHETQHLRCLTDLVDTQTTYYAQCHQYMVNMEKQLGSFSSVYCANNNQLSLAGASDGISRPSTSTASGATDGISRPSTAPGATDGISRPSTASGATDGISRPSTSTEPGATDGISRPSTASGATDGISRPSTAPGATDGISRPSSSTAPGATDGISRPSTSTEPGATVLPLHTAGQSSPSVNELHLSNGTRKARVLYDYSATCNSELSLLADEVITVTSVPGMDSDWLMGERGDKKGKVPITYLQLQS